MEPTPDLSAHFAFHAHVRVTLDELMAVVEDLQQGPRDDRRLTLARRAKELGRELRDHLRHEDEVLFPALAARVPTIQPILDTLAAEHDVIAGIIPDWIDSLTALSRRRPPSLPAREWALVVGTDVRRVVFRHIETEDEDVLPLFYRHFSAAEYQTLVGEPDRTNRPQETSVMHAHQPTTSPLRNRQRLVFMFAGLLTAALAVLSGCDSSSNASSGDEPAARAAMPGMGDSRAATVADEDAILDLTATDFDFTVEDDHVDSGQNTVQLTNKGSEAHQVHIGRAPEGVGPDEFIETFESQGENAAFELLTWVGGVAGVEPGASSTTTLDLPAGDYLMVCYLPSPDGHSHVMKEMVVELHVTDRPESAPAPAPITPDHTVGLVDYQIQIPEAFTGQGQVAVTNSGKDTHELIIVKLDEGKTLGDAAGWDPSSGQPAPFTFAGGAGSIEPGTTEYVDMDLEPGDYIATCQVQGLAGVPHIQMGMVAPFTVT